MVLDFKRVLKQICFLTLLQFQKRQTILGWSCPRYDDLHYMSVHFSSICRHPNGLFISCCFITVLIQSILSLLLSQFLS